MLFFHTFAERIARILIHILPEFLVLKIFGGGILPPCPPPRTPMLKSFYMGKFVWLPFFWLFNSVWNKFHGLQSDNLVSGVLDFSYRRFSTPFDFIVVAPMCSGISIPSVGICTPSLRITCDTVYDDSMQWGGHSAPSSTLWSWKCGWGPFFCFSKLLGLEISEVYQFVWRLGDLKPGRGAFQWLAPVKNPFTTPLPHTPYQ